MDSLRVRFVRKVGALIGHKARDSDSRIFAVDSVQVA